MASSTLKGLVANSGKLGYQLWHRPLKMASLVLRKGNRPRRIALVSRSTFSDTLPLCGVSSNACELTLSSEDHFSM